MLPDCREGCREGSGKREEESAYQITTVHKGASHRIDMDDGEGRGERRVPRKLYEVVGACLLVAVQLVDLRNHILGAYGCS